jgi:AcrR family transcriptional regulator
VCNPPQVSALNLRPERLKEVRPGGGQTTLDEQRLLGLHDVGQSARADLLAAAWEMVREGGLGALSLRKMAGRAGIITPTVYAYFESKNAILDAMFGEAAGAFEQTNAAPLEDGTPQQQLAAHAHRFAAFCTSDVARYQLLFQHLIPGFSPSPESYAPAVRALDSARQRLEDAGVREARHVDVWTALMTGLVDQQISNDPHGDRWIRLIDEVVAMFLAHCVNEPTSR